MVAPLGPTTRPTTRYGTRTYFLFSQVRKKPWTGWWEREKTYLNGDLARDWWRRNESSSADNATLAYESWTSGGPNLWEMFGRWQNLSFGSSDIFFTTSDDKNGFFSTYRRLDVSVGFSSQSLDFTPWIKQENRLSEWNGSIKSGNVWIHLQGCRVYAFSHTQHRHGLNRTLQTTQ